MNRKPFKTYAAILATALGLLGAGVAGAQAPVVPPATTTNFPGDWPNLGAYNNRQGRNGDPLTYNSGLTTERWTAPATVADTLTLLLDDTDIQANFYTNGGPYDVPLGNAGYVTFNDASGNANYAAWGSPATTSKEAGSPYVPVARLRNADGTATTSTNFQPRTPSYHFAFCTPSAHGDDPTVPVAAYASDLRTVDYNFTPPVGPSRNYEIYAYLPIGSTDTSAGTASTPAATFFPQRFLVYRIFYSNGLSYTDVVDTLQAGNGFIRLGNGGLATSRVFPYTNSGGTAYPIRVRLYNTVPRYNDGSLAIDGSYVNEPDSLERSLAQTRLVYADAFEARPTQGSFVASPSTQTMASGVTIGANPAAATIDWRVTVARNNFVTSLDQSAAGTTTLDQNNEGTVISYQANPNRWPNGTVPQELWRYSTIADSNGGTTLDDNGAGVSVPPTPFGTDTANPYHLGADYLSAPAVFPSGPPIVRPPESNIAKVTYAPTLAQGGFGIYAYIPGNGGGETYGTQVEYRIYEGATLADTVYVDQSTAQGYVQLGSRRYNNVPDTGTGNSAPLTVVVTNYDNSLADAANGTAKVYTDAIRFVGNANRAIDSSPVHATVNITGKGQTKVVIAADESGRIHCLDLTGNGDGTTTEYWSYPSTSDGTTSYSDPNAPLTGSGPDGSNGVITATMPTGFDLSTAAVAHVGSQDLLYIGATNGRVYCIDMAGRGDYDGPSHKIGTTQRQWTYPNDYDPSNPSAPKTTSTLGAFRGSIVVGDSTQGLSGPTVFVPARQGRIYALDALGSTTTRTTTVTWQYPAATLSPLPPILMTPTLFKPSNGNARLFFGTQFDPTNDGPGRLYALDATNGDLIWLYNGSATRNSADVHDTGATIHRQNNSMVSFRTGVLAVAGTTIDAVPKSDQTATAVTHVDTLYALNDNLTLYGFDAATGAPITYTNGTVSQTYASNDLDILSDANLSFTVVSAYNRAEEATPESFPVVVVPGNDGQFRWAFARVEDYNQYNGYYAGGFTSSANVAFPYTSAAASNNFLFAADGEGRLFALDAFGAAAGNLPTDPLFDPGITADVPPNDPAGDLYRHLKIKLVNKAAYGVLRAVGTDPNGSAPLTYDQAVNDPQWNGPSGNPLAFEWGETAYVLVYGFPFTTQNRSGAAIAPPTISLQLSVDGKVVRNVTVDSRKFLEPPTAPNVEGTQTPANGFAVVPFAFNNSGPTALPPGVGRITASISTGAFTSGAVTTTTQTIAQDTRSGSSSEVDFHMANPLAVVPYDMPTSTGPSAGIGDTLAAAANENAVNGSPNVDGNNTSQILASAGITGHGTTATARFAVEDRSLIVLLHPEGLTNIRLQRSNLQREGGVAGVFDALSTTAYPGFEDQPGNYPNTSLDYPDIGRERVRAVKDPNGTSENPLLTTVTLKPPLSAKSGTKGQVLTESDLFTDPATGQANERQLQATLFTLPIDVPRYQPPVNVNALSGQAGTSDDNSDLLDLHRNYKYFNGNAGDTNIPQGYFGRVQVYADSNGNGQMDLATSPEPYRALNYAVGVQSSTSILTGTPTVDLGSLASGTGYAPLAPAAQDSFNGPFSPWNTGAWGGAYQPVSVRNDGNVNLLHLRLARALNTSGNVADNQPWPLSAADNDPLAWLAGVQLGNSGNLQFGDLWSNFSAHFAATHGADSTNGVFADDVILPKPRVVDRAPTELVANPFPRANPNIRVDPSTHQVTTSATGVLVDGTATYRLNANLPTTTPKVAVSVPIGFPVGNYKSQIQVVENSYARLGSLDNEILEYLLSSSTNPLVNGAPSNQWEAYSDPISLTFKVRESRLTNGPTPRTAPMIDAGVNGTPTTFNNAAPAAMRDGFGSLVVAWQSDRAVATGGEKVKGTNPSLLYFSSLGSQATFTNGINAPGGNAPLWDLSQFAQGTSQWFTPPTPTAGYPANPQALFLGASAPANTSLQLGTVRFGSPSFPARGQVDPLSGGSLGSTSFVGFVGDAQVQTPTGTLSESRVFVAPVTTAAGGGLTLGSAVGTGGDLQTAKGKPSVLQLSSSGGLVFYAETASGGSGITVSRFSASGSGNAVAFGSPVALNFGDGFSSVFSPSVAARTYRQGATDGSTKPIVEVGFAGKLRGRPNAEPFMGRVYLDATHTTIVDRNGTSIESQGAGNPFVYLPLQSFERLSGEGDGVFRARGVVWNRTDFLNRILDTVNNPVSPLVQYVPTTASTANPTPTDVLVRSTATVDPQSGLIACDSRLGGKVYIDPELGTVRLVGGILNRNAQIRITYQPTFLRVTAGGTAGYSSINALFDDRYVSEYVTSGNQVQYPYWYTNANNGAPTPATPSSQVRNDRFVFAYGRGATGALTARPYSTTMRLGVRLPTRMYTDANGNIGTLQVSNNTRPYQVDPANGRIYFQAEDEGRTITISYTGVNEATNGPVTINNINGTVSFVLERDEAPIQVDEAANDSALTAFLDPFTYPSTDGTNGTRHERPPLVWLFYTSTRAGGLDVYFQTVAPRYLPYAK